MNRGWIAFLLVNFTLASWAALFWGLTLADWTPWDDERSGTDAIRCEAALEMRERLLFESEDFAFTAEAFGAEMGRVDHEIDTYC